LGIGAGPAALNNRNPELIQFVRNAHLVFGRQGDMLPLRAVAKGRVEDFDSIAHNDPVLVLLPRDEACLTSVLKHVTRLEDVRHIAEWLQQKSLSARDVRQRIAGRIDLQLVAGAYTLDQPLHRLERSE